MPDPVVREPSPAPPSRAAGPKLLAAVVAAAVVGAIAFVVFGGSASKVVDPVAQAATVSASAPGYRMHMSMEIASPSLPSPITATGDGAFNLHDRSGSMSLTMSFGNDPQVIQSLGSSSLKIQEIVDGTTIYMKLPGAATSGLRRLGKQWIAIDLAKLSGIPGLSSLQSNPVSSNPSEMLQYLRVVSDSIVSEGHQRVDGLASTHYRAQMSLDRAASAVPAAERAAAQQALSKLEQLTQIHQIPVDVWVDAHHLVRRMGMTMALTVPGGQALNETFTIDISHYGPVPRPALPPADQVAKLG